MPRLGSPEIPANRSDEAFIQLEYQTLREEIKQAKEHSFKTLMLGVAVVPAAQFLAHTREIDALTLVVPLVVLVVGLLYLANNHTIMRCGRYIRMQIEPRVSGLGWEQWLCTPGEFDKRSVDRLLTYSFYLLFLVYFVVSTFLAVRFSWTKYGHGLGVTVALCYLALGTVSLFRFGSKTLVSTMTATEPPPAATARAGAPSQQEAAAR